MKLKFLLLLLFFLPRLAFGAVAIDADSSSSCTSCPSLTWSHTVGASGTLLICGVHPVITAISTYKFNAISLTPKATATTSGGILGMWFVSSPSVGSHSVEIVMSGTADALVGGCTSFTGAGTLGTAISSAPPDSEPILDGVAVTVPTDGMAFGLGYASFAACTNQAPDSGNTERYDVCADAGGNNVGGFAVSRTTSGQINWTNHPSGAYEAVIGVPINPAAVGGGVARRRIITQ